MSETEAATAVSRVGRAVGLYLKRDTDRQREGAKKRFSHSGKDISCKISSDEIPVRLFDSGCGPLAGKMLGKRRQNAFLTFCDLN